jgi:phosphatidylserine/phosphatidylglycerophosphate/cardiolipin synthase-like enzyme
MKKILSLLLILTFFLTACSSAVSDQIHHGAVYGTVLNRTQQNNQSKNNPIFPPIDNTHKNIQVYFPRAGQDPAPVLVNLIKQAHSSCHVAIYSLTNPEIVKALVEAHKRGIDVKVITDRKQTEGKVQKHAINILLMSGIPVKINTHPGLMHLKMTVIDGKIATAGSYNYTKAASEENDEMFVVITDPDFVKACQTEFERMWTDSQNFTLFREKLNN